MNTKSTWGFTSPLSKVDPGRIIHEAEQVEGAKAVRFTIDGKVYTAIKSSDGRPPLKEFAGYALFVDCDAPRRKEGLPVLQHWCYGNYLGKVSNWFLYNGDRIADLDLVKTKVEVF